MGCEMIYWIFEHVNPFLLVLVICPFLAFAIGMACSLLKKGIVYGICAAFLLPLLFIASDAKTIKGNIDAWILYGLFYVCITYAIYNISARVQLLMKRPKMN